MKKTGLLIILTIVLNDINYSQTNTFPASGSVGIGTTTPLSALEIKNGNLLIRNFDNTDNNSAIMIAHSINYSDYTTFGTSIRTITQSAGYNTYGLQFFTQESYLTGQTEKMRILGNGNIGIGTDNPVYKLQIKGSATHQLFAVNRPNSDIPALYIGNDVNSNPAIVANNSDLTFGRDYSGVYTEYMRIQNGTGNIGIGTEAPTYKLDVCGTIRAKEVKVDLQGGCDFVFKSDYKLMDLKKLEEFVKTKQHLPEIAPEKEMVENGVNMKDLQMKLLQKMEELTLYTIEQNKKIKALEEKIEKLESALK